jgi:hypothetical protein
MAVPSHRNLRPSKHQPRKIPSSKSSSSFSDNPIKQKKSNAGKTGSGKAQPKRAMAQFEEALKAKYPKLSKGFQQQSQLLLAQFKLLMEKEIEDGNLEDGNLEAEFDDMSLAMSSAQDSSTSSDILDSECPIEVESSVSSTPRAQILSVDEPTPMEVEPAERVKYCCTYPGCIISRKGCNCRGKSCKCPRKREIYWSYSKVDLRRHEESDKHWPQESFMCLECPSAVIDPDDLHQEPRCAFVTCRSPCLAMKDHTTWDVRSRGKLERPSGGEIISADTFGTIMG